MVTIELAAPSRGGPTSSSPFNEVLGALTDDRRRVLHRVIEADGPVAVRSLAWELSDADRRTEPDGGSIDGDRRPDADGHGTARRLETPSTREGGTATETRAAEAGARQEAAVGGDVRGRGKTGSGADTVTTNSAGRSVDVARLDLEQLQLPALTHAGLLEWDRSADTVEPTDHPVYEDHRFRQLVAAGDGLDEVIDCLANGRRSRIVSTLIDRDRPMPVDDLVEALAEDTPAPREAVRISLEHTHLPRIEDAGFVVRPDDAHVRWSPDEIDREWIEYLLEA